MRPILVYIPAKPAFVLLLALGLLLSGLSLIPRFRKSSAASWSGFALLAAGLASYVGAGSLKFWQHWNQPWNPLPIYSYGVMLCLSLTIGWYLALELAGREGLPKDKIASCYMQTAIWAIVGARLLYVITNWGDFENRLVDIVMVNKGGLVAYGGFLGGFVASWIYCVRNQIPLLKWADNAVPSIALGLSLTRIGCFLYGCDFGARTNLPWAVHFPGPSRFARDGSPAYVHHLRQYDLSRLATESFGVHPTQLYESLLGLALFGLCLLVRKYRKRDGMAFVTFVIGYGIPRFLLEFVRDDEQRGSLFGWSTSQLIGIMSAVAGIVLYLILRGQSSERSVPRAQVASSRK